ncbi:MAG TPA: HK97 family phage prohead protease [Gemmataceae bacterium]|nr:HK97 family phage prohead protease [Gemmataceae bacterium]
MTTARAEPKTHATAGRTLTVDPAQMVVRAVISTAAPDRAGDVIVPVGLRNADEFLRNPVVLWAHQRSLPPIGTCERLTIEADRIIAETKFSQSSPFARDVFGLYAEGVLRGWSVGFVPTRAVPMPVSRDRPRGGTCYPEWDLLEYSAVPVPENPQALTLAVRKGLVKDAELRHWLVRDVLAALYG